MSRVVLIVALLALGGGAAGCTARTCTMIGCLSQVRVVISGLAENLGSKLPVTVLACADRTCSSFLIEAADAGRACTPQRSTVSMCTLTPAGDIELYVPLPAAVTTGASVSVHATASDPSGTVLFDGTRAATITGREIDGVGCGVCNSAEVTLSS